MKFLDRFSALLFNLCILLLSVLVPVLVVASTPAFYQARFQETGIYASVENGEIHQKKVRYIGGASDKTAVFSDEQIDTIIEHFVDYFFGDKETFALKMNGVLLNGTLTDDVDVFGETAVTHMQDVKDLFQLLTIVSILSAVFAALCIVYFCRRPKRFLRLLWKYSIGFYLTFLSIIAVFCIGTFFTIPEYVEGWQNILDWYPSQLWRNMHYIFFIFAPENISGSFFNDALTMILTLDFFMTTVFIILAIMVSVVLVWLITSYLLQRRVPKKQKI